MQSFTRFQHSSDCWFQEYESDTFASQGKALEYLTFWEEEEGSGVRRQVMPSGFTNRLAFSMKLKVLQESLYSCTDHNSWYLIYMAIGFSFCPTWQCNVVPRWNWIFVFLSLVSFGWLDNTGSRWTGTCRCEWVRAIGRESVWAGGKCYGGQGNGPVMVLVREVLRPNQGPLLAGWPVRDASLHPVQYSNVQ